MFLICSAFLIFSSVVLFTSYGDQCCNKLHSGKASLSESPCAPSSSSSSGLCFEITLNDLIKSYLPASPCPRGGWTRPWLLLFASSDDFRLSRLLHQRHILKKGRCWETLSIFWRQQPDNLFQLWHYGFYYSGFPIFNIANRSSTDDILFSVLPLVRLRFSFVSMFFEFGLPLPN